MTDRLTEITTSLKAQLLADKKKSALLGILFLVFLAVLGRALFSGGNPAPAEATPPTVANALPSLPTVTPPLIPPTPSPKPAETKSTPQPAATPPALVRPQEEPGPGAALETLAAAVRASLTAPKGAAEAAAALEAADAGFAPSTTERRDLFTAPAWERPDEKKTKSPRAANGKQGAAKKSRKGGRAEPAKPLWDHLGNALGDYQQTRRSEIAQYEAQLAELQLQSTLTGPAPIAYISGRLVREGDTIRGFTVARIEDRRVVVRKQSFIRVLIMP